MISIVVIDDEIQDTEKIKYLLHSQGDLELRGLGKDGYDAIRLVSSIKPDIALLNVGLNQFCGVEISHLLKRNSPSTAIIAMGSRANINMVKRAVSEVVAAYILKEADFTQLAEILRKVHRGENYFNPVISTLAFRILASLLQGESIDPFCRFSEKKNIPKRVDLPIWKLSRIEMKILAAIGEGRSNKEIADRLKLKDGTVRNYISRAMRKTGLKSRTQTAVYAIKNGLSDSS